MGLSKLLIAIFWITQKPIYIFKASKLEKDNSEYIRQLENW